MKYEDLAPGGTLGTGEGEASTPCLSPRIMADGITPFAESLCSAEKASCPLKHLASQWDLMVTVHEY